MRDLAITGLGAVSPMGWSVEALWKGLLEGVCALGPLERFDASEFRTGGGGEVPARDGARASAPAEQYLLEAAREALAHSGAPAEGTWLVAGTNFGGMSAAEASLAGGADGDLARYEFRSQLDRVAAELGLGGGVMAVSLSCASGTAALVLAADLIESGRAERVLAAGYDELSLYAFAGLAALRAMSTDALRPFDVNRGGTLFSEGAGAIVVEEGASARARGAEVLARLAGGALNNDAFHMTAPDKEGKGVLALVRAALADAGIGPDEIAHVNLHGTGTKYNDLNESRMMRDVFGERAGSIPVTANKGAFGHAMGAAGALECVAAVKTVMHGLIPPTVGLEEPDPECGLDVVLGRPREALFPGAASALKTSYGIGGTNAAVVIARPEGMEGTNG